MSDDDFHPQSIALLGESKEKVSVDAELEGILEHINRLGIKTYQSCQNYADYLRQFEDMDHVWDTKREYGYIEFYSMDDALRFIGLFRETLALTDPLYFKVMHSGTPEAWEVRINLASGEGMLNMRAWVLFPQSDIPQIEAALKVIE